MEKLNELSYEIRKACFKINSILGPGLFESVYEEVMNYELIKMGFDVKRQESIPIIYEGINLDVAFKADLIVNDAIIIEIKAVEKLHRVHIRQVLTYLKLSNKQLGLLVNFNSESIDRDSFIRLVNSKKYDKSA